MGVLGARLRRWHRRLSWLAGAALILWAGSGLLHPLMSWTNPRPVAFTVPAADVLPVPPLALAQVSDGPLVFARLLQQRGRLMWQVRKPHDAGPEYFDAATGQLQPDADRERALWLARHYSGRQEVAEANLLTTFNIDYPEINRLLPVWCIRFEGSDALEACVHTTEDRLATLSDRRKRVLQSVFQNVHTLSFLDRYEGVRLGLVLAGVGSVLAMTMLGSGLLLARRASVIAGSRRVHRALAWGIWLPVLMLSGSGLFHLAMYTPLRMAKSAESVSRPFRFDAPTRWPAEFTGARELTLIALPKGGAAWRVRYEPGDLRVYDAVSLQRWIHDDADLATRLAGAQDAAPAQHLLKFSHEYGFANKRLPVWRIETLQGLVFVDTSVGLIAARASSAEIAESWSFSTLHKWQFLDPLGRLARDALLSFAALCAAGGAIAGLMLARRRASSVQS